ncbi:MAG: hypothetical protein QM770_18330 [Tepidisphaeraceae bacterium]
MSTAGVIAGTSGYNATVWRNVGTGYQPTALQRPANTWAASANWISPGGTVVGYALDDADGYRALAWLSGPGGAYGAPVVLPVPAPYTNSTAYSIGRTDAIAGFVATDAGPEHAAIWTPNGTGGFSVRLLPDNGQASAATSVDSFGNVVGYRSSLMTVAWFPDGSGGYDRHDAIGGESTVLSFLNDNGFAAGYYAGRPIVGAFYEGDLYCAILDHPQDDSDAGANHINGLDYIVGDANTPGAGRQAQIWLPTDTFWDRVNVDEWLDATSPPDASAWKLLSGTFLSEDFKMLGDGQYTVDGSPLQRAFVLDATALVPEPTVGASTVCAILTLTRQRRLKKL